MNVYIDRMTISVLDEKIDFAFGEQVEGSSIVVSWMVVGVHILVVHLDQSLPLVTH